MFFDPDDYLLEDICERLYDEINKEKCDLVSGNAIFMINNIPYYDFKSDIPKEIIHPNKNYKNYKNFRCWGTLYDKNFIKKHEIRFINVKVNEDTYFVHKCFFNAEKISYLNDYYGIVYFIRNEQTLSKTFSEEVLISTIEAFTQIRKLIINMGVTFDNDPFLIGIILRLFENWDLEKQNENHIYLKMLDYKRNSKLPKTTSFHIRFAEKLLEKKYFKLLHYYRRIINFILNTQFIRNKLNNKYKEIVKKSDNSYEHVYPLRNY